MKLSFYGADQCVTGSCHCLEVNGKRLLIDCGLQQGRDEVDNGALPFAPGSIDFVLITHAHIDHSGRVPHFLHGNRASRRYGWLGNQRTLPSGVHKTDIVLSAVLC